MVNTPLNLGFCLYQTLFMNKILLCIFSATTHPLSLEGPLIHVVRCACLMVCHKLNQIFLEQDLFCQYVMKNDASETYCFGSFFIAFTLSVQNSKYPFEISKCALSNHPASARMELEIPFACYKHRLSLRLHQSRM